MASNDQIVFIILIVIFIASFIIGYFQYKKRIELLTYQAEKRGGEVIAKNLFSRTRLLLPYRGEKIEIYSVPGSRYSPPKTVAQIKSNMLRFPEMRIVSNSLWQKMLSAMGRERILTGNDEFDKRFAVKSEDPYSALRLLPEDLKARLLEPQFRSLDVNMKTQEFSMTILSIPRNNEEYDLFIDTLFLVLQKTY